MEKVSRQPNPIPRTEPALWTDFMATFNAAFTDTTKRQNVTRGLRVLREQLFLRLLLTTCRASEYTLDLESCLGTLRQS
jgi:hypothetical protein